MKDIAVSGPFWINGGNFTIIAFNLKKYFLDELGAISFKRDNIFGRMLNKSSL